MDFKDLIRALETESEIYKRFEEVEDEKTAVIIEGNVEKLDAILNVEQGLHMKVQNVEKMRIATIKKLGLEKKTLLDIIEMSEGVQKETLSRLLNELNTYISAVKRINDHNTKLVKSRLELIATVNSLYIDPETGTKVRQANVSSRETAIYGKDAKVASQADSFERAVVRKKL